MTETLAHYLEMGGYARFVWPAYGVALVTLVTMALVSVVGWRRQQRLWAALEAAGQVRRRASDRR